MMSSSLGRRMIRKGSVIFLYFYFGMFFLKEGCIMFEFGYGEFGCRKGVFRDMYFFEIEVRFKKIIVLIRIFMIIFEEDVGDVCFFLYGMFD